MESIVRAAVVYIFLLLVFRLSGRRTLSEMTMFDFILVLIVSESVQEALIGDDRSLTNAGLVIFTLVMINIALSMLKLKFLTLEKWIDGRPFIIVDQGRCLQDRLARARVDERDIMEAARLDHGLERLDQIKYAVLERNGRISIVPKESSTAEQGSS
ncbi:MAG TPA: YetF domain-containing protein [Pseudomonadales bacterium]